MASKYSEAWLSEKLSAMRDQFTKELTNLKNPDEITKLILKAKIITIGQVMDELEIDDPDDKTSIEDLQKMIENLKD